MVEKFINSRWTKFWFALSVMAFAGLGINTTSRIGIVLNLPVAFILAIFIEYKYKVLNKVFEYKSKKYALISLSIAIYTIIEIILNTYSQRVMRVLYLEHPLTLEIRSLLSEQVLRVGLYMFLVTTGIVAFFAVFAAVYTIVSRFEGFATRVWRKTGRLERVYFVAVVLVFGIFIAVIYSLSPIFWGDNTLPDRGSNFIFDLDVGGNTHHNFQFYSTLLTSVTRLFYLLINLPFALAARALGRILFFIPLAYIYFLQVLHIGLMAWGGILLARMCNITGISQKYFLALYTISYSFLVFSIPPERYILPTFCVILLMYVCIYVPNAKSLVALAAAGTLTTSIVVLPFVAYDTKIKTWFLNFFKLGSGVVVFSIFCGMLPVIYNPIRTVVRWQLGNFAGAASTGQQALQFINFVGSIFVRPETALRNLTCSRDGIEFIVYALAPPMFINWIGILLIALTIAGFIANRKLRFAQMSFLWAIFAFFVLFVIGWQARNNEMFLSSLYFGWAFFVLAFMFFEKLLENYKIIKYTIYSAIFIVMAVININGIIELVQFGIQHYPAR